MRYHGPWIAAVGDIGVTIVEGYGMNGDEDTCWAEGWDRFGDKGMFGRAGSMVIGPAIGETGLGQRSHGQVTVRWLSKQSELVDGEVLGMLTVEEVRIEIGNKYR